MTCSTNEVNVRHISLDELLGLRTRVLRPHFEAGQLAHFDGDALEQTWHMGAWLGDELVGCVTMMQRTYQGKEAVPRSWQTVSNTQTWQLRGMAVDETYRGQGYGGMLLRGTLKEVQSKTPNLVWCNAREAAMSLYARAGFEVVGARFDVPVIGPHYVMGLVV